MFASSGRVRAVGWPEGRLPALLRSLPAVAGFAALTALLARVALPVPGTPVPVSLQSVAVLLSGVVLGSRRGAASQALYVLAGVAGLPVFAGARAGMTAATGGYLLGFVVAAWAVGSLCRRFGFSPAALTAACMTGAAIILVSGASWMALLAGGDLELAFRQGVWPFLVVDGLKVLITVAAVQAVRSSRALLDSARGVN